MNAVRKIKVLQAIRQGKVGGGETHILSLVKHLDKERFESVVLSFTDGNMISELNEIGVKNYVIQSEKAFDVLKWGKVKTLIQQEEIDLIHIHGTRAGSNLFWAASSLKLPTVYTIHGWSFHDNQSTLQKKARIFFEQWVTSKTCKNISVSESNQQTGLENIPNFKSQVINNGIDTEFFNPENSNRKNLRNELKIANDACVICFAGRMTHQKEPLTLIKAFKVVVEKNKNAVLLLVGEGELQHKARQLASELNIQQHIIFENFRNDIADVLFSSDIFCLPSLWEGLPIALLEAMAIKKAVVVTNVDGSKELIQNGKNGLVVPMQNAEALANALSELVNDKTKRCVFGEAARQTVLQGFDVKSMTKKIEGIYLSTFYSKN